MVNRIKQIDERHPVTCGLHVPNLVEDNGLRVSDICREVDFPAIHGYPMYADWADGPLDTDFLPFICALTSALCGKPALMEEFGGPTTAPGEASTIWEWQAYEKPFQQFVASEEDFAKFVEQVLPKLIEVGATGAVIWCFADYSPELYDRPPCDEAHHERFFGLVRPDGSLKPHAKVLQRFSASQPKIKPVQREVTLDITPEAYYQNPLEHAKRFYKIFKSK
jgi:endo-1,4-beta-mannosidase